MKPSWPLAIGKRRFPITDCFFQSGIADWAGYSSPFDDEGGPHSRNFHDFSRKLLMESARERAREMVVFALVIVVSAWPVVYMIITVVKLLSKGRPD